MTMSHKVAGLIDVRITTAAGVVSQLQVRGKWKITPSGTKKEGIAGQDGVHGYKEMPTIGMMEGDVTNGRDFDISIIDSADDITATALLNNGHIYVGKGGWRADVTTIDTEDGSIPLKLEFMECKRTQ